MFSEGRAKCIETNSEYFDVMPLVSLAGSGEPLMQADKNECRKKEKICRTASVCLCGRSSWQLPPLCSTQPSDQYSSLRLIPSWQRR